MFNINRPKKITPRLLSKRGVDTVLNFALKVRLLISKQLPPPRRFLDTNIEFVL